MGYKLVKEVMDNAPRMSLAEWKAMVILAEDANDASRLTWSPTTAAKITRRLDLAPHAWANLRGALVRKGLLEVVEAGRRGRCAKYRFPLWPQFHPQVEDETENPAEEMSPPAEDETEPMCPQAEDASAEYVLQEGSPTHQYNSSEQDTHQYASAVAEAPADAVASSASHAVACSAAATKIPKQRQADDPRTGWVPYYLSKEPAEATKDLYAAISRMDDAELIALWAEFEWKRPSVSRTCRERAQAQNEKEQLGLDAAGLVSLALKYGVQHYEGKWPAFVVPESKRPAPPEWAAAA